MTIVNAGNGLCFPVSSAVSFRIVFCLIVRIWIQVCVSRYIVFVVRTYTYICHKKDRPATCKKRHVFHQIPKLTTSFAFFVVLLKTNNNNTPDIHTNIV